MPSHNSTLSPLLAMPLHVVGASVSNGSVSAGFVVDTVRRLNANFGTVESLGDSKLGDSSLRQEVKLGSSLRVLLAIRQANGGGTAED